MTTQVKLATRHADSTLDPALVARAEEMLSEARTALMLDAPFYGAIALRLTLVANARIAQGTAATDGRSLFYNPEWIIKQTHRQLVGLLAHEVEHIAFKHTLRREGRNPRDWNVACDHVINNDLTGCGFELPEDGLCDSTFKGWAAEEVYPHVARKPQEQPQSEVVCGYPGTKGEGEKSDADDDQQSQRDDDAPEDDDADTNTDAPEDDADDTDTEEDDTDAGDAEGDDTEEDDTQGAGDDEPEEMPEEERLPAGGVLDSPDPVQDEAEINVAIVQAGMVAQAAGNLPANLKRLINELTRAHVDWRDLLAEFLIANMREDYTMRRPNKRYMAQGVYLPSLKSEAAPELALIGDNSGSINEAQFSRCVRAIGECAATIRPERTHVLMADSRVNYRATFERGEEVRDIPTDTGGGGTDFSAAFQQLAEEGVTPACAVYYTADADGWFGEEPEYPVLWLVEKGARTPPWGQVVLLDDIREGV